MPLKRAFAIAQPEVSKLIRELRQLTGLTQEQLAAELGVAYGTINRWENGHMQPSPLALRRIRALIDELSHSSSQSDRDGSRELLTHYFSLEPGL
ncbi:helix-turn-helix transcriptional regulator [Microcoleus sp. FACHB-53]|nr:helix-turn-helix transcriptional regulator [Microcoleus sp. FACHB-53]MBD2126619.1 helix-turn-helix transcriptional regulator [Microcoleus sp. FACHB-1]